MALAHGPVGSFSLKNNIVLITGGASGIGIAFAIACLEQSARVVVGDLASSPGLDALTASHPSRLTFRKCDVTSWSDIASLITSSKEIFGGVPDVYAPCAGIYEPSWSNFWDDTEDEAGFYKTIRINVEHPIKLTRLAIRALKGANKQGVVILVSSTAGIRPNYLACLYSASKHALIGFTRSMAQADADEGIKVVCILPGLVDTDLWRKREDDMMKWTGFGERKALQAEDIAECMGRLAREDKFRGGCCVLKTATEERILFEEEAKAGYDPSPRPETDLDRVRRAMNREKG